MYFPTFLHCYILQEEKKKRIRAISLCFCAPHSQTCGCLACSARGSLLPSQAEIKAGAEQVGKLGLRVEPFRYHMPPFFIPPLTKGYGRKHALPLPLSLSLTHTHTQTLRRQKQQPHHWHCFACHLRLFSPCQVGLPFDNFLFPHCFSSSILTLFCFFVDTRAPCVCNRMPFPLLHFIFYRQEWQCHSQWAIIEILVWLGSQDTPPVDVNLIARS